MEGRSEQSGDLRWHALSSDQVFAALGSSHSGLREEENASRLSRHGPNEIERQREKGVLHYFAKQINQPLIYALLLAAVVTTYLQEWADTIVIVAVVLANALIGLLQERKAGRDIEELMRYSVSQARVRRAGQPKTVPSRELVPGDVVLLQAGDMLPADLRLFLVKDMSVDESVFTGESIPVVKTTDALSEDWLAPADRTNMAFSGTIVVRGRGEGVVTATGAETEVSKISAEIRETKKASFPLVEKIAGLTRDIAILVIVAAAFTLVTGFLRGYEVVDLLRAAVALAVAAIPEGLPAMVTVALSVSVRRMAARNAVVRSLPAVEALGSTTVICADKTGTLTLNQMRVVKVHSGGRDYEAVLPDYRCVAHCDVPGQIAVEDVDLFDTLWAGMMCNDSVMRDGKAEGEPTEAALLFAAQLPNMKHPLPRLDEIPFETTIGYMATLHEQDGKNIIFVKGAHERVIDTCTRAQASGGPGEINQELLHREAEEMAIDALRVLAIAKKEVPASTKTLNQSDVKGLTFLGLVGMIDPPRPESLEAINACHSAGVRVIMITGDHKTTAKAIAERLGLLNFRERVVSGTELEKMNDRELTATIDHADVFARVTPDQKLRIVRNLRDRGEVVAVTGDGVNDAPALKAASIGVAMGQAGTDAARAAADMVLKDDNFATIVAAVEEGRDIYAKVRKIIAWALPTNIGEALMLLVAISLGTQLPLLPLQILWVNLATAITVAVPLVFEPREQGLLARSPRKPGEPIINRLMVRKFVIVAPMMVAGTFGVFNLFQGDHDVEVSRTIAMNTLVFFEMAYLLNTRSLTEPAHRQGLLTNLWIPAMLAACLGLQLAITYLGPLNEVFGTAAIGLSEWLVAASIGSTVFAAIEIEKWIARDRGA